MRTKRSLLLRSPASRLSSLLAEQRSRDDEPLDLLGPLVELGDLRVAHHPLDRELVDVAVAAEDLDGVRGDPHRGVPGHEFTHRRPAAGVGRAGLDLGAGLVQELAGRLGRGVHVGEHRRRPSGSRRSAGRTACAPWRTRSPTSSAPWAIPTAWAAIPGRLRSKVRIAMREAVALLADPVGLRDADAVERQLGGRAAADAHLVLDPRRPRSPGVGTSTTKHDSRRWRGAVGVGHREDHDQVGDRAVADEPLRAVDDVVVAVADAPACASRRRPSRPPASVRANAISASPGGEVRATSAPAAPAVPARRSGSAPSSWTARISPVVAQARLICSMARQTVRRSPPRPPCSSGNGSARMSCAASSSSEVLRELAGPVDVGGSRRDPLVGEHAHGVAQEQLLLGQAVGAVGWARRGHRGRS